MPDINIIYILTIIIVVFVSMVFHEAMHAFTSDWLGDDTARLKGRLTLNPIAHIDPIFTLLLPVILAIIGAPIFGGAKPVPFNPSRVRFGDFGAAIVALAGPLTNLFLAFLAFVIYVLLGTPVPTSVIGMILNVAILVNIGFFVFNILPIPPLDGSRLLYALAPDPARHIMETIERYGILFVFVLVMLFSQQISIFMQAAIQLVVGAFSAILGVKVL